jgi:hypothetical protein
MKLSEFKNYLTGLSAINFVMPNGDTVAAHFHITEIGLVNKQFIDCGGEMHTHKLVTMQIWVNDDIQHRLAPTNLLNIISLFEKEITPQDIEIELEYEIETIGKYSLEFDGQYFKLIAKRTDCLAKTKCMVPTPQNNFITLGNACTPGGGCC